MSTNHQPAPTDPLRLDGLQPLADWGLIRASGADATQFLQAQLTQDLAGMPPGQARLAGYCTPKGRLVASFIVWRSTADDWLLACSADLLTATLKRLSMFVLRAKCQLSDASDELALWGLAGDSAAAWLGDAAPLAAWAVSSGGDRQQTIALPAGDGVPRFLHVAPRAQAAPALPELAPGAWAWLEVGSGVVRITAATAEAFVPQMVNFELVGGVDFRKGCYPGQEVVARSQYRGTLKRRGAVLSGVAAMVAGQEIYSDSDPGQPAGQIALAASLVDGRHRAFAELKLAASAQGSLHLGSATGPVLTVDALPYALPQDAD